MKTAFPIAPLNVAICGVTHPHALVCTLRWDHKGPHAAHTTDDHVAEIWGEGVPEGGSIQMTVNSSVKVDWEMMDGTKGTWFFNDPRKAREFTDDLERDGDCYEFAFYPLAQGNRGKYPDA